MLPGDHLGLSMVLFVVFILHNGLTLDLQGSTVTATQSSINEDDPFYAWFAVDQDLNTFSHTGYDTPEELTNPWWKVDLGGVYCLRKITLVNARDHASRLADGVVRAGLNSNLLLNPEVGRVSRAQATDGAVVDFTHMPYVTAQYVSVNIIRTGSQAIAQLTEVMVEEATTTLKDAIPSGTKVLNLTGCQSSQISSFSSRDAGRAVDGVAQYVSPYCSQTNTQQNPWWKIDLTSYHCISKIAIRNIDDLSHTMRLKLEHAVARAGLSNTSTDNAMCGSPVTQYQALINDWIEFTCNPSRLARYVSIDIPAQAALILCEVIVLPCNLQPPALSLSEKPRNQSSTISGQDALKAFDGLPEEPFCSVTDNEENPWWRVDLESSYCLGIIRVRNTGSPTEPNLQDAVVRAGLSEVHTNNIMCGTPVTSDQSVINDWIEFACDPPVLSRYVSVDIPGPASLKLCEVTVSTCDFQQTAANVVDFTVAANPALLGNAGDSDSSITAYKGAEDISVGVSFGRQLPTGGRSNDLPSGSVVLADPSTGCADKLVLRLPEESGIDRTGVFFSEMIKNNTSTRIHIVILAKGNNVHVRPIQLTQTANIGEFVMLQMRDVNSPSTDYRWRHNGGVIIESWNNLLNVSIPNVTVESEGIYACFALYQEMKQLHGIMRLIVRGCPFGCWDPPSCLKTCRRCYNGGVCDDKSGTCVCPPGFNGDSCERAHGRHIFGKTADQRCSSSTDPHHDACRGRLFCLPDPYGCSCAAGYKGLDCMQDCDDGTFGADCKQTCHCAPGGTCSKDTGECSSGCASSYFGSNCQCSPQNGVLGLEVTSGDPHQLFVTWQPDPCASGYELTTRNECEDTVSQQLILENTYHLVTGLELPLSHRVYILPVYPDDERGPEVTFPQATKPTAAPSNVNFTSATPYSLSVSWSKPPCGSRGGIIIGYTYKLTEVSPESQVVIRSMTSEESVTIEGLTPQTEYSFQVAANTTVGAGPYSKASRETTLKVPQVDGTPVPGSSSAVAGGVTATVVILILLVIVAIALYKRQSRPTKKPYDTDGDVSLKGRDIHFLPDPVQETPSSAHATVNPVEICPDPPPTPKPKPDLKPRRVSTNSPKETLEQPVVDEDEEELPYAELPSVREENLAEYIRSKDKAGEKGFPMDFKGLPKGLLHPATVAEKPENKTKNRYANVLAYDHSRIVLQPLENDPHSDYINACFIDGYDKTDKYIASQGPNKGSLADIWRMVRQYDVDKIIMLTNPVENGKVKCQQYWPDTGSKIYSDVQVKVAEEKTFVDYTIRLFKVVSDKGSRLVKQFHFKTWPDMEPPEYPTTLLNFMRVVNKEHNKGRTVIHCSAGIGRTGTYIALDSMLDQMQKERRVDVLGFIYRMRQKRTKMVQTPEQYRFVFDALLAASMTGNTAYEITDFRRQLTALKEKAKGAKKTGLEKQFETLLKLLAMKRSAERETPQAGLRPENVDKNRFADFPAKQRSRAVLMTSVYENDTDYINAHFLPGYHKKSMYISTQMPMPNTVADIWRLVYDYKVGCIVMLNPLDPANETMCQYWPEKTGSTIEFGPLLVELTETKEYDNVRQRVFTLRNKDHKTEEEPRTVCQFECLDWPSDADKPTSLHGMLNLMGLTQEWLDKDTPIVAHCIDGVGRSAVYCAIMSLLEQSKEEKLVDVFQAVFRLRMAHHNVMYSVEHYTLCYEILQLYLDSNVIYANL